MTLSIPSTKLDFSNSEVNQFRFSFKDTRDIVSATFGSVRTPAASIDVDFYFAQQAQANQCSCTALTDLNNIKFESQQDGTLKQIEDGVTSYQLKIGSTN